MDDFYMDMDSFDNDAQLSIIDEEKLKVLDKIEKYVKLTRDSVKFNEVNEYNTNFRILSCYISLMSDLSELENEYNQEDSAMSEDKLHERINNIELHVEEISNESLRNVGMDDRPVSLDDVDEAVNKRKSGPDDDSFDF